MSDEKEKTGLEMFQEKVLELCNSDIDLAEAVQKFADLEMDFEFVKNLNTELSNKYQSLMDTFPTSKELEMLIGIVESSGERVFNYSKDVNNERLFKLKKFKSALVALEAQDHNVIPIKYDELVNENGEKED